MRLISVGVFILALLAFCCVIGGVYGSGRASWSGTQWSIPYEHPDNTVAATGIFVNVTGHEDKVFVYSLYLSRAIMAVFDIEQLIRNQSATPLHITTDFSWPANGASDVHLRYSTHVDGKFYFTTSDGHLLQVDPSNLNVNHTGSVVSNVIKIADRGPLLPLLQDDGSMGLLAVTGPVEFLSSTRFLHGYYPIGSAEWQLSSPGSPRSERYHPFTAINDYFFVWNGVCSINATYGYFIGSTYTETYVFRSSSSDQTPKLAMVFRDTLVSRYDSRCVYNADSDTLYLPLVNTSTTIDGEIDYLGFQSKRQVDAT